MEKITFSILTCLSAAFATQAHASCEYQVHCDWGSGQILEVLVTNDTNQTINEPELFVNFTNANVNSIWGDFKVASQNPVHLDGVYRGDGLPVNQTVSAFLSISRTNGNVINPPTFDGTLCGFKNDEFAAFVPSSFGLNATVYATSEKEKFTNIKSYQWDYLDSSASGEVATLSFDQAGTYPVTLTITTDNNEVFHFKKNVTVSELPERTDHYDSDIITGLYKVSYYEYKNENGIYETDIFNNLNIEKTLIAQEYAPTMQLIYSKERFNGMAPEDLMVTFEADVTVLRDTRIQYNAQSAYLNGSVIYLDDTRLYSTAPNSSSGSAGMRNIAAGQYTIRGAALGSDHREEGFRFRYNFAGETGLLTESPYLTKDETDSYFIDLLNSDNELFLVNHTKSNSIQPVRELTLPKRDGAINLVLEAKYMPPLEWRISNPYNTKINSIVISHGHSQNTKITGVTADEYVYTNYSSPYIPINVNDINTYFEDLTGQTIKPQNIYSSEYYPLEGYILK
ncbi:PKD domain-containing protein [Marinicellulosiphila megalodicopiae]|uniref:PKD domain-containing protein n=1 Tax=Marinicellulosiphila megalodicopiae TaxID=2724896 RepID=UPI003BAF0A89